ncbi:retrovirus-related Pol polyprotein from transposon 412 [Trichonephila clavipes]|nr:retrovirus-related Pol polyprotein from transposon 412 [Trichonephila clavipes]
MGSMLMLGKTRPLPGHKISGFMKSEICFILECLHPPRSPTREAVCRSSGKYQARRLPEVHSEYSTTESGRGSNGSGLTPATRLQRSVSQRERRGIPRPPISSKREELRQRERKGSPEHHFPPYGTPLTANMRVGKPTLAPRERETRTRLKKVSPLRGQKLMKDKFPLPIIEDVLDTLQEAKVYSTLDLRNGFFHVDVDEDCRKYTSFIVLDGQFEFNKVPFGLSTSPGVFQRYVSSIFRDLTRK